MRLNQIFLMVSDFETAREFYGEKLGLSVEREKGSQVAFDTGECTLVLEEDFDEETLAAFGLEPPVEPRGSGGIIVIEVEDVDHVYNRLSSHDVALLMEPREVEWGRKLFLAEDPEGYVLEISQPIEADEEVAK